MYTDVRVGADPIQVGVTGIPFTVIPSSLFDFEPIDTAPSGIVAELHGMVQFLAVPTRAGYQGGLNSGPVLGYLYDV